MRAKTGRFIMVPRSRFGISLSLSLSVVLWAAVAAAQTAPTRVPTTRHAPDEFGTQDYTVTTIPAAAFIYQYNDGYVQGDCSCTSFQCGCYNGSTPWEFYAGANIPSGAVIDFVGLESFSTNALQVGVTLWQNDRYGAQTPVVSLSSTAHGWDSDYNAEPLGFQLQKNVHNALVLNVELAGYSPTPYFGWVEIWWKRSVSPPPAVASFNDVPTTHPFFQFIEALKASGITAGCQSSPPLYCPDEPLTRGQMAVFLAKALGLQWN